MHSVEQFRELQREVTAWRRYLHENPELDFQVHNTARFVTENLGFLRHQSHRNGHS